MTTKPLLLTLVFLIAHGASAQCTFSDDFEDPGRWVQIGELVEITAGSVTYLEGAPDGEQRRVYRQIGATLNEDHMWTAEVDFNPLFIGNSPQGPVTGHNVLAVTAGDQEPLNDCPDIPCTGNPVGTQDGIMVVYRTTVPSEGPPCFRIIAKDDTTEIVSNCISGVNVDTWYYLTLERINDETAQLSVFTDPERSVHADSSPVILAIPQTLRGLTHAQHGNIARGDETQQLTGTLDNLCIEYPISASAEREITAGQVRIYPNPVRDVLYIEGLHLDDVTVMDLYGRVVLSTATRGQINVQHLEPGTYLLSIGNGHEQFYRRFVKQ